MHITICDLIVPHKFIYILFFLHIHGYSFQAICYLNRNRVKPYAACLLEVGKLRDLHAIQPYLPAQSRGAESWRFPVIFHKSDIMVQGIYPKRPKAVEIYILYVYW